MRLILENPSYGLNMLEKNKDKYTRNRYEEIKNKIKEIIKIQGNEYLKNEEIRNAYIDFDKESELNGFKILDIDKVNSVIGKKINYEIYQLILNTKGKSVVIDHINMNRFDNRKANLRICTPQINRVNQEAKGCYYEKQTGKYLARIKVNGKEINIGRYNTEREAEEIYLKCNILLGYDKISFTIKEKIKERNIALSEEDLENKYIKKVYNLLNDIEEFSIEKAL